MGFYLDRRNVTLHTDTCETADGYVKVARMTSSDNWPWFETYTEAFFAARGGRTGISYDPDCSAEVEPDAIDRRVLALYGYLTSKPD